MIIVRYYNIKVRKAKQPFHQKDYLVGGRSNCRDNNIMKDIKNQGKSKQNKDLPDIHKPLEPNMAQPTEKEPIIKSLSYLMTKKFTPTTWIVPGILPEGTTILAGRPKLGKSAMALNIALAVAYGVNVFDKIKAEQGAVLFCSLEDGERRLRERIDHFVGNLDDYPNTFDYVTLLPGKESDKLKIIEDWLKGHPNARLIVVDTLAKFRATLKSGERLYDNDYQSVQGLKRLAELYKTSILIIHHTRKADADDVLDTVSGTLGLVGAVDGILILKRERGKIDAILSVTGRDIEEKEYALKFTFPFWELLGDAHEFQISKERQIIISALKEIGKPASPKEIYVYLQSKGEKCNLTSITNSLLPKMVKAGEVKNPEYGKYSISG